MCAFVFQRCHGNSSARGRALHVLVSSLVLFEAFLPVLLGAAVLGCCGLYQPSPKTLHSSHPDRWAALQIHQSKYSAVPAHILLKYSTRTVFLVSRNLNDIRAHSL